MKIKCKPEDFVVEEEIELPIKEDGKFFYYKLTKKNWNTKDIIQKIKQVCHVNRVGFAGLKDKYAVTTQYISLPKVIRFELKDVEFEQVGRGNQHIYLGMLKGNKFTLVLRDLDKQVVLPKEVLNVYGPQRFGTHNAEIGKNLILKDFKRVAELLEIEVRYNDYVTKLRKIGVKELLFYIHAYQSLLWNQLAKTLEKEEIPILGFLTEGEEYNQIMEKEGITKKDFIVRSLPEISSEGGMRKKMIQVQNFETLEFSEDELHKDKMKQIVKFSLTKGAYATTVISSL
jgi:tRNA(Glu) U13 pseudouridine synthase TruD